MSNLMYPNLFLNHLYQNKIELKLYQLLLNIFKTNNDYTIVIIKCYLYKYKNINNSKSS